MRLLRDAMRCRCGKFAYRDELSARIALSRIKHKDKVGRDETRVYPCKYGKWHLTSKEERK